MKKVLICCLIAFLVVGIFIYTSSGEEENDGQYINGEYIGESGYSTIIVKDGQIVGWKLNTQNSGAHVVGWDWPRMSPRVNMVLWGYLIDEDGKIETIQYEKVKVDDVFEEFEETEEYKSARDRIINKVNALTQKNCDIKHRAAVLETYITDAHIAGAYSYDRTNSIFLNENDCSVELLGRDGTKKIVNFNYKTILPYLPITEGCTYYPQKGWREKKTYEYEEKVKIKMTGKERMMWIKELEMEGYSSKEIEKMVPYYYTHTEKISKTCRLFSAKTAESIRRYLTRASVNLNNKVNVRIRCIHFNPETGQTIPILADEVVPVIIGDTYKAIAEEYVESNITKKSYRLKGKKEITVNNVVEDCEVIFFYEEIEGDRITAVLKGIPEPNPVYVKPGVTKAKLKVTLDGSESTVICKGIMDKVDKYRFWLGDLAEEKGIASDLGFMEFNDYEITFDPVKIGQTKKVIIPAKMRIYSKNLQTSHPENQDRFIAVITINIEVDVKCGEADGSGIVPEPGDILFDPHTSKSNKTKNRGYWTNNKNVYVTYKPDYGAERRSPLYSGIITKVFNMTHTWSWKDYIKTIHHPKKIKEKKCVDEDGKEYIETTVIPAWDQEIYNSRSDSHTDRVEVGGYWDLEKIYVEGTGINNHKQLKEHQHNSDKTSSNKITLTEGKNLYLNGYPANWDSNDEHWLDSPQEQSAPSLSSMDIGPRSHWSQSTSATSQFRSKTSSPSVPSWDGSSGFYNIDYTDPTAEIICNYEPYIWYGGKGTRVFVMKGKIKDDRSGIYTGTLKNRYIDPDGDTYIDQRTKYTQRIEDKAEQQRSIRITKSGKHMIYLDVEDNAGNTTDKMEKLYLMDNTIPEIELEKTSVEWINQEIGIPIKFIDRHSGIDKVYYTVNNESKNNNKENEIDMKINLGRQDKNTKINEHEELRKIEQDIKINEDGIYYIQTHQIEDAVGNERSKEKYGPYKYDSTYPNIRLKLPGSYKYNNRVEIAADQKNEVEIEVKDNLSGVAKLEYAITKDAIAKEEEYKDANVTTPEDSQHPENTAKYKINLQEGKAKWEELRNGRWYLHIKLTDRAGNQLIIDRKDKEELKITSGSNCQINYMEEEKGKRKKEINAIEVFINKAGRRSEDIGKLIKPKDNNSNVEKADSSINTTDLRIVKILDPAWQNTLKHEYINVDKMAVYSNKVPSKIKLGYAVDFELDTVGYGTNENDKVIINARKFIKTANGYKEVEVYLPKEKGTSIYKRIGNEHESKRKVLSRKNKTLVNDKDKFMQIGNAEDEKYRWSYSYYIRPDAKFVIKQENTKEELDINNPKEREKLTNNGIYTEILIVMDIELEKEYGDSLKYTQKEDKWGDNKGSEPTEYGFKKSTGKDLINLGKNKGEVFWYRTDLTLIDDLEGESHFQGE